MNNFINEYYECVGDTIRDAVKLLAERRKGVIPFGISYLDDAFGGIVSHDLLLIGAQTGRGKTQLAVQIAEQMARAGKKVFYFALEAYCKEIQLRLLFSEMRSKIFIDYWDFMSNNFTEEQKNVLCEAVKKMENLKNLLIFYKLEDFSPDEFEIRLTELQDIADVIIVDHFHFFDFNIKENETIAHKTAIKKINMMVKTIGIPIILLAHLNKAYQKSDRSIPNEYDFYGTGDLINIATKVLLISDKLPKDFERLANLETTIFYAAKNRENMMVRKHFGITLIDSNTGNYLPKYYLGDANSEKISEKIPRWAKNTKILPMNSRL